MVELLNFSHFCKMLCSSSILVRVYA